MKSHGHGFTARSARSTVFRERKVEFGLTVAVNRGPAKTASIGVGRRVLLWEGAAASIFFVDPKEQLLTVFMIQKRQGITISREYKRMVCQSIVD